MQIRGAGDGVVEVVFPSTDFIRNKLETEIPLETIKKSRRDFRSPYVEYDL